MAQMADPRDPQRAQYPPPDNPTAGDYYSQQSPSRPPVRDDRNAHPYPPPPDSARQGQYGDPRAAHAYPPPPQGWPGHHSAYPPPPHYPDPQHPAYAYPPRPDLAQPPQPMQPDAYRLPPPYPPPGYYPPQHYPPPPAAAPRQRTAIACKYCRKRKIRCSGYDSSPDGRCQNCVRFNQQCLFHPVSSQAAFVPANAVYGPGARAPVAGQSDRSGQNGHYSREGEPPMLYGAHGQPLGPPSQYNYPPAPAAPPPAHGYPPAPYPPYPGMPYPPPTGSPYDAQGQAQPAQHDERVSLKRPPPDDDPHNENSHTSQSPHPASRARHSTYDSRANSSGSYEYHDPNGAAPTSPAVSTMSYQSYPPQQQPRYANGTQSQKGNASPPSGLTPQSAQGYNSPHHGPNHDDGRTPPPNQPNSAGSSANGRSGMKVHEMLGNPAAGLPDQRGRSDNEMLSKLDGKK
ncbi:hypothetical protein A1O3_08094 [Capronia epimyces CBS 606.96]|uniref:Zn(2)-C6 fungal-type domain-containing protein n=1 Tax=Capronia epimyces CBS 606.96 TaxID=1182542 RepID=W9YBS8_9EURO|nr:uncharacterized protein A1O3_08094 [Capronia epimyces CBS 606.96]EXJ79809.1 hypothetical protein A1O3_08094 [Capronia epimyces CBS 606.96]